STELFASIDTINGQLTAQAASITSVQASVTVAQSAADGAQSTANGAQSTANGAQSTANSANSAVTLISASGLFQLVVTAGVGDVVSRMTAQVRASIGSAWVDAGLIMEAGFTGGNPALPFSNYIV